MSLSPIKQEILETMLLNGKPQKAMEIAKEAHREFQPVMMHLLGLTRMGYVATPEKGLYALTCTVKKPLA
jgi:predicted transcriptional regulator